jgi:hypothetical protein
MMKVCVDLDGTQCLDVRPGVLQQHQHPLSGLLDEQRGHSMCAADLLDLLVASARYLR